ncbi:MAG: YfhO family protein [Pirellulaceae bacterium]
MNRWPWHIWLLVLLPVAALFGPVLLTDRSFAMRDAAHFYHPLFEWTTSEWSAGRVPLWNPHENCGVPVLADASSSVFYPGKLMFALPLDFTLSYKLYVIGHLVLAAVGSYLLARHWKSNQVAAGAAALAYACGGNVVFQYCNVVFLVGAAWLPFAALAADRMLHGQSWRAAVALGVVLALMILGGDPQAAYHVLLMTGLYALVLAWMAKPQEKSSTAGIWQRWKSSQFGRHMLLLGLAAVAGFLLSAIQVLPSSEASKESERAAYRRPRSIYEAAAFANDIRAGRLAHIEQPWPEITHGLIGPPDPTTHHERAYYFSVGPWRFAELIWPNVSGRMFPTHRRWLSLWPAEGRIWTPTLYMGLIPLLLSLAQLRLRSGDERTRWLSWLVLLFTLGSLGWYGLGWIAREFCTLVLRMDAEKFPFGSQVGGVYWLMTTLLPTYVSFRYPAKLLVVSSLALSQLAAFGWDRLFAEQRGRFVKVLTWLGGTSAGLLVIAWGAATWLGTLLAPGSKDSPLKERVAGFLRQHADSSLGPFDWRGSSTDVQLALFHTTVICAAFLWLLHKAWKEPQHAGRWQIVSLLVVALDLALANYWLVPAAPATIWRDHPAVVALMDTSEHPRVFRSNLGGGWRPEAFGRQSSRERMSEITQWERDTLFPKYGLNHGISLVESYGSLKSVHYESFLVVARSNGPPQPGDRSRPLPPGSSLRLLGTKYLMLPDTYVPGAKDKPLFAEKVITDDPPAAGAMLWKMKDPFPRAWIVHHAETLPPLSSRLDLDAIDQRAMDVLFPVDPRSRLHVSRDLRTSAVVETEEPIDLTPPARSGRLSWPDEDSCRITISQPTLVEIEVALASPGLVVLGDTYAPGWVALLRSAEEDQAVRKEVRIHRTNRIFRGVVVPAGRHVLTYEYRPVSFYRGAAVSAFSWLALGLLTAFFGWRRRGKSAECKVQNVK